MNTTIFFLMTCYLALWPVVVGQGLLTETRAVLGILPTSQLLLAGGGLVALKLAILARFLALIGLIKDHRRQPAALLPDYIAANDSITASTGTPPCLAAAGSYFDFPHVLQYFGFGRDDDEGDRDSDFPADSERTTLRPTITFKTSASSSSGQPGATTPGSIGAGDVTEGSVNMESDTGSFVFENDTAYFPIPGLKIGFDNKTGKNFLMFAEGSGLMPTVLVPASFAQETGLRKETLPAVVTDASDISRFLNITPGSDLEEGGGEISHRNHSLPSSTSDSGEVNYLLYPLLPTNIRINTFSESGFATALNESQLLVRLANRSVVPIAMVGNLDFTGFQGIRLDDAVNDSPIDDEDVRDEDAQRSRRSTAATAEGENIPAYFSLIHSLDVNDCFARLACEIGSNATHYGKYGQTVGKFFAALNASAYHHTSDAHHYISHYDYGREHRFEACFKGSACKQNMMHLIEPLNML